MDTISQSVGIRNGMLMMPNTPADLRTITGLLDRIPLANGGTAATPGLWSSDRTVEIGQVTAAIIAFQTANNRPVIDGVVDPGGGSLRLMNSLAAPGPITATVVIEDVNSHMWAVADPPSVAGTGPIRVRTVSPNLTRRLISVNGTSIKWFGVVVPVDGSNSVIGGSPLIFFTPSPWQGHYYDPGYDSFTTWKGLWDKYTSAMGSQMVEAGVSQILVLPFYKNSQAGNLGQFLINWKEVVSAVVTAAIVSIDPLYLRNTFEFDHIYSASFSNGIVTHQNFNTQAVNAAGMTRMAFDLDGQASGSNWRPIPGISYRNTRPPFGVNPNGFDWHVGQRLGQLSIMYPGKTTHNLCPFLLLHGLTMFGN